jgi:hypothetical protein
MAVGEHLPSDPGRQRPRNPLEIGQNPLGIARRQTIQGQPGGLREISLRIALLSLQGGPQRRLKAPLEEQRMPKIVIAYRQLGERARSRAGRPPRSLVPRFADGRAYYGRPSPLVPGQDRMSLRVAPSAPFRDPVTEQLFEDVNIARLIRTIPNATRNGPSLAPAPESDGHVVRPIPHPCRAPRDRITACSSAVRFGGVPVVVVAIGSGWLLPSTDWAAQCPSDSCAFFVTQPSTQTRHEDDVRLTIQIIVPSRRGKRPSKAHLPGLDEAQRSAQHRQEPGPPGRRPGPLVAEAPGAGGRGAGAGPGPSVGRGRLRA